MMGAAPLTRALLLLALAVLHVLGAVWCAIEALSRRRASDVFPHVDARRVPPHVAVAFEVRRSAPADWRARLRAYFSDAVSRTRALQSTLALVRWCALAGVTELSVYDAGGVLREALLRSSVPGTLDLHAQETYPCVVRAAVHARGRDAAYTLCVAPDPEDVAAVRQERPLAPELGVRLNVLDAEDDKPSLVRAAHDATNNPLGRSSVDAFESAVAKHLPMATWPDLLIVCGRRRLAPRLYGFPGWALRLTDIWYVHDVWPGLLTPATSRRPGNGPGRILPMRSHTMRGASSGMARRPA